MCVHVYYPRQSSTYLIRILTFSSPCTPYLVCPALYSAFYFPLIMHLYSVYHAFCSVCIVKVYFFPFFFFFPPVGAAAGTSCTFSLSSSTSAISSSGTLATPAMGLLNLPSAVPTNLVTSWALVVRYFSVTPDTGSKVLRTREARGVASGVSESVGLGVCGLMEYLVVILVCKEFSTAVRIRM